MPQPITSTATLNQQLTRRTIWIRGRGPEEAGHSLFYLPERGVLRTLPTDPQKRSSVAQMHEASARLFGTDAAQRSILPPTADAPLLPLVEQLLAANPAIDAVLFEGFAIAPEGEGAAESVALADALRARGLTVWFTPPEVARRWISKPEFRARTTALLGEASVPPGRTYESPTAAELVAYAEEAFADGCPRVILKVSGAGGFGNVLLDPGDPVAEKVAALLAAKKLDPRSDWVSAERWQPWRSTLCCSFFVTEDSTTHVGLCQQLLSQATAGFHGGRSFTDLAPADAQAIIDACAPLVAAMRADGLRGYTGIDVIVSDPSDAPGELRLPSGLALRFIECNPRMNGHNQELLVLAQLAERDGVAPSELIHLRSRNVPVAGAADYTAVLQHFTTELRGVAAPLNGAPLAPGEVAFVVDTNDGERPSIYDAIMLVARRGAAGERGIDAAYQHLLASGALKT